MPPTPVTNDSKTRISRIASPTDPIIAPNAKMRSKNTQITPIGHNMSSFSSPISPLASSSVSNSRSGTSVQSSTYVASVETGVSSVTRAENLEWNDISSHYIICISNIPWDLTTKEVTVWLQKFSIVETGIHILMDRCADDLLTRGNRTLGKTLPDAFIEVETACDARLMVETFDKSNLKNRQITVKQCSISQLLSALFPSWGLFSTAQDASNRIYLTRAEISSIVSVCKNYKMHFSRKCADRAFENVMSIVRHIPWKHSIYAPATMHRDHIFEMLKVSIDALRMHLSKEYYHVSRELLDKMVRVGVKCPGFTERQKLVMLQAAGMECPPDLIEFMEQSAGGIHDTSRPFVPCEESIENISRDVLKIKMDEDEELKLLKEHEKDIMQFYQKETARWQHKCKILEERLHSAMARITELEKHLHL